MELTPTTPEGEDPVLNTLFENPYFDNPEDPRVSEILGQEIRPSHRTRIDEAEQVRDTRKLFGNDYLKEYDPNIARKVDDKFRNKRAKSKRSKRLPQEGK